MVLGAYLRRSSELLVPFRTDGLFRGLVVELGHVSGLPDAAWADYQRDGDKDLLSPRYARFFRSTFAPSLASAISDKGKRTFFADRPEEKLKRRLTQQPVPLNSFVYKRSRLPNQVLGRATDAIIGVA
jgi:hypothetical protein